MYSLILFVVCLCQITSGFDSKNLGVIGGVETPIRNFPFQVSLQYLGIHNCGGVIISRDAVLTSASCIDLIISKSYKVVAGASNLKNAPHKIGVEGTIVHENYTGLSNDIALIKLNELLEFSEDIQPVNLPKQGEEPNVNETVSVSGYGITSIWSIFTSNTLRYANVSIVDHEECRKNYTRRNIQIPDSMVCAGVPDGSIDICQGDIGSPLSSNGTLIGIASLSRCGESGYPGVYTKVSAFREWIRQQTGI